MKVGKVIRSAASLFGDGLIAIALFFVLFILASGGGVYSIGNGIRISVRNIYNPLAILSILVALRLILFGKIPFFRLKAMSLERLSTRALAAYDSFVGKVSSLESRKEKRIVFWTIVVSVLVKMIIAYVYFGFYSGDDVEIQEMSFARLFGLDWQAWGLRSPVFPMAFIYPVQFLLKGLGVSDAWPLIYAGRLVVVAFSALNLWLVYRIAKKLFAGSGVAIMSLFILAFSKLHTTFAASELPRTVASTFILLGFWFLLSEKNKIGSLILSGSLIGLAAAIRFSEIIYICPAVLYLCLKRSWGRAVIMGAVITTSFSFIIGLSDALYWKSAFHSLKNIVDYTLVKKLSSRGYEPFHYYVTAFSYWTDILTFILAIYALKIRNKKIYLWAFCPVILLSFLPHKEPRYLLPALPFWALLAGLSAWNILERNRREGFAFTESPAIRKSGYLLGGVIVAFLVLANKDYRYFLFSVPLIAVMIGLYYAGKKRTRREKITPEMSVSPGKMVLLMISITALAVIIEINGFRFQRSESGVEMARYIAANPGIKVFAVDDSWRAGGKLYYAGDVRIINIEAGMLSDPDYLRRVIFDDHVQAVGIQEEHLRNSECAAMLKSIRFIEAGFSEKRRKENYRLFVQEGDNSKQRISK